MYQVFPQLNVAASLSVTLLYSTNIQGVSSAYCSFLRALHFCVQCWSPDTACSSQSLSSSQLPTQRSGLPASPAPGHCLRSEGAAPATPDQGSCYQSALLATPPPTVKRETLNSCSRVCQRQASRRFGEAQATPFSSRPLPLPSLPGPCHGGTKLRGPISPHIPFRACVRSRGTRGGRGAHLSGGRLSTPLLMSDCRTMMVSFPVGPCACHQLHSLLWTLVIRGPPRTCQG